MSRFSLIYAKDGQYQQLYCTSQNEAIGLLQHISVGQIGIPIGVYDAKTELFSWETNRQQQYNRMSIEEQARLGSQIIAVAQTLRRQQEHGAALAGLHQAQANLANFINRI